MRRLRYAIPIILFMLILTSCRSARPIERGFYYWKSIVKLDATDNERLKQLHVGRFYVKCFDVVWDETQAQAIPVAEARFVSKLPPDIEVIPTVYITNETLKKTPSSAIPNLANRIREKTMIIISGANISAPKEFQVDCDWTLQTRDKYFQLLRSLHKDLETTIELTATIRLHQVKYMKQTGIPPVDRGILMAYNLESPADIRAKNSIILYDTAKSYLDHLGAYPLPLDIGLPLYSLGAIFQGERCIGLIADLTSAELRRNKNFIRIGLSLFQATSNTYLHGAYIYKNDQIRIDESDLQETIKVAAFIGRRLQNRNTRVILFDYNAQRLGGVRHAELEALYRSLR